MKHQNPTAVLDNVLEDPADLLVTLKEICARLGLTPYDLGRRAIARGVLPTLATIGARQECRLVFTAADLDKMFTSPLAPVPTGSGARQDKPARTSAAVCLNFE